MGIVNTATAAMPCALCTNASHAGTVRFGVQRLDTPTPSYNKLMATRGNSVLFKEEPMGSTYSRKATFRVSGEGAKRVFTPVNKRAKTVARKLGKRTRVTLAELRSTKGKGTYKFYAYQADGSLKAIR